MKLIVLMALMMSRALACEGFLPANDLYFPAGLKSDMEMKSEIVDSILGRLSEIYRPDFEKRGRTFVPINAWYSGVVNAFAQQGYDGSARITIEGGLGRHPSMTPEGIALVACHEIGHHLGGAPQMPRDTWASAEGQADYFATLKCLRRYFQEDDNFSALKGREIPAYIKDMCAQSFTGPEKDICLRSGLASLSVANLFAALDHTDPPVPGTTVKEVVEETFLDHPRPQCRLETFLQGSFCQRNYSEEVSATDETQGTCHPSLGDIIGNRPACWYKSRL